MDEELQVLWAAVLTPISEALAANTTVEQLLKLRQAAVLDPDTPPAIHKALEAFLQLRRAIEGL